MTVTQEDSFTIKSKNAHDATLNLKYIEHIIYVSKNGTQTFKRVTQIHSYMWPKLWVKKWVHVASLDVLLFPLLLMLQQPIMLVISLDSVCTGPSRASLALILFSWHAIIAKFIILNHWCLKVVYTVYNAWDIQSRRAGRAINSIDES